MLHIIARGNKLMLSNILSMVLCLYILRVFGGTADTSSELEHRTVLCQCSILD